MCHELLRRPLYEGGFPVERQTTLLIVGNTGPREAAEQGDNAGGE